MEARDYCQEIQTVPHLGRCWWGTLEPELVALPRYVAMWVRKDSDHNQLTSNSCDIFRECDIPAVPPEKKLALDFAEKEW